MYQKIETENKNSLKQCSVVCVCVCVKHSLNIPLLAPEIKLIFRFSWISDFKEVLTINYE